MKFMTIIYKYYKLSYAHMLQKDIEGSGMMISYHMSIACNIYIT